VRYVVRIVIGIVLGLLGAAVAWWLGWRWWTGAILASVLALVGFLGSFFLWSADRPEEGYEQVLFDLPNNLVSVVLVLALVGLAFAGGHGLARGGAASAAAPPDPAVAALAEHHDNLTKLYNAIQGGTFSAADATNASAQLNAAKTAAATFPGSAKAGDIATAAGALAAAVGEFTSCGKLCDHAGQLAKADALPAGPPLTDFAK
jgi:hypothetical protein